MECSKTKSRSEESLCGKSMKFVSNIIRASSFSLANRTLGTTGKPAKDSPLPEREIAIEEPLLPRIPSGRRLQEPQSPSNPTYVEKNAGSTSHVKLHTHSTQIKPTREDRVDVLASEYIQKIRGKLGCGLLGTGKPAT